jgi:hypothetical protein
LSPPSINTVRKKKKKKRKRKIKKKEEISLKSIGVAMNQKKGMQAKRKKERKN